MGNDNEVQVQFKAVVSDFLNGLREATDSVKESTEGMTGDIGSLAETINKMGSAAVVLAGVGLAFEGMKQAVEYVQEAVRDTNELAEAFKNLGYATGASTAELNAYAASIELSGGKVDELTGLMVGMQRGIRTNSDALIANGVAANKAALDAMSFEDYLRRVYEIAESLASPTEREQFLIMALGRSGATAGAQLKEFVENMDEAKRATEESGIVTDKNRQQLEETEKSVGRLKIAQQTYAAQVAANATPILNGFRDMRTAVVEVQIAQESMMDLATKGYIQMQYQADGYTLDLVKMAEAARQFQAIIAEGMRTASASMDAGARNIPKEEPKHLKTKESLDAEKAAAKASADEHKRLAKEAADAVKQSWEEASRQVVQVYDWEQQWLRKQTKEKEDLAKQAETEEIDAAKDGMEKKRALLDQEVAMGKKTHAQELEELKKITQEEAKIETDAITKRQKEMAKGSLEYRKLEEQKLQISRKTENAIATYEAQKLKERLARYKSFSRSVGNDFAHTFTQMIKEGQSFGQFWNNLMGSLEDTGLQMLSDFISSWIEKQLMAMVSSKTTATSEIAGNAGVAATAAMASAAAIPMVGWAMAPGVGAETFAAAMGYMGSIASAALGFDIPEGVNPITQLHEREMVLPAEHADTIRNLKKDGGGDGLHIHLQTFDAKSFHGYLRNNKTALVKTLKEIHRDGRKS
jgi:hypothetical protein